MESQDPTSHSVQRLRRLSRASGANNHERSATQAATSSAIRRTAATPSISFLQRHRLRRHRDESDSLTESLSTVQEAVDRLNEASSNLSTLLDEPIPSIRSPDHLTSEYYGEAQMNSRRAKRRKLDMDQSGGALYNYGYRGQVVSGPLKMSIALVDGGYISESTGRSRITHYPPHNVLRNDKSVYCTQASMCNLILRHPGDSPFCLTKVVIKAPKSGFDAPIQEGMIFVAMGIEDLLTNTSQYRLRENTPTAPSSPRNAATSRRDDSTRNYGYVPNPNNQLHFHYPHYPSAPYFSHSDDRPPSRRAGYLSTYWDSQSFDPANRLLLSHGINPLELSSEFPSLHYVSSAAPPLNRTHSSTPTNIAIPVTPLHHTTNTPIDFSGDEEEESSPAVLADLADRCRNYPFTSSSEDEEDEAPSHASRRRTRRLRSTPRKIEWVEAEGQQSEQRPGTKKPRMLKPHATFFIENPGKHGVDKMVCVRFDPPVSGRYILFKLWSPAEGHNIDIQSILCHGFAGPRFFPAVQLQ